MKDTEITDIVEMIRNGRVDQPVPEQEAYFDAGYTPPPHKWKIVKKEYIDGKLYYVYSWDWKPISLLRVFLLFMKGSE